LSALEQMAFDFSTLTDEVLASEYGLVWSEDHRRLVDPETGEVFQLEQVTDLETAKAATFRIMCNEAAISRLQEQIKSLQSKVKQRTRRKVVLESLYKAGIIEVARELIEAAKKGQSTILGYLTVGYRKARAKASVRDNMEVEALRWAMEYAPDSVRLDLPLNELPALSRKQIAEAILAMSEKESAAALGGKVRCSLIDEGLSHSMPTSCFEVTPGDGVEWFYK
jgi:hypothetical protein